MLCADSLLLNCCYKQVWYGFNDISFSNMLSCKTVYETTFGHLMNVRITLSQHFFILSSSLSKYSPMYWIGSSGLSCVSFSSASISEGMMCLSRYWRMGRLGFTASSSPCCCPSSSWSLVSKYEYDLKSVSKVFDFVTVALVLEIEWAWWDWDEENVTYLPF